jgi:hypothetical protein
MPIYGDGQCVIESAPPILTGEEMAPEAAGMQWEAVRVRFTSPMRVKLGGRLAPALDFHGLVAALIHRLFPMVLCHCGASPDPASCQRLIDAARGVQQEECNIWWERRSRRSARQGREIPMDGFVGEVTYQGNLAPLMPLLVAGTYVGVGKGTVFGNGEYQLVSA